MATQFITEKTHLTGAVSVAFVKSSIPPMETAQNEYLLPLLGDELMEVLLDAMDGTPDEKQLQAIKLCRRVVAPFAFLEELPHMQSILGDNGLKVLEAEGSRPTFKWEYQQVQDSLQRRGYAAQEALLQFLAKYRDDFPEWATAPYNTTSRFNLVRNGKDLSVISQLREPYRCYLLIQPMLVEVGELVVEVALGKPYYDALNERIGAGTTTEDDNAVLDPLRRTIGNLALANCANRIGLRMSAQGFTVAEMLRDTAEEGRKSAGPSQVGQLAQECKVSGEAFLGKAVAMLNELASATRYTEFFNGPRYQPPVASANHFNDNNSGRKGFFAA